MNKQHKVTLLHNTPLWIGSHGARTCWESHEKSDNGGPKDCELLDRVGNKFKHQSILEHVSYNFFIEGVSRALLQELSRHRMASYSVKSTRYTLKELKEENPFSTYIDHRAQAGKYLVYTGVESVDVASILSLERLRQCLVEGISNDKAKYCLPEAYKTTVQWTINMRSLQNFLSLRSDKSALWEIRELAHSIYEALPEDHKYMYEGFIKEL